MLKNNNQNDEQFILYKNYDIEITTEKDLFCVKPYIDYINVVRKINAKKEITNDNYHKIIVITNYIVVFT